MTLPPWDTAVADQVQAATRDARRGLRDVAAQPGWQLALDDGHPHPWIAGLFEALYARMRAGQLRACPHLRSPRPVYTAAWLPDRLYCEPRLLAGALNPGPDQDNRCDRCGSTSRQIHPKMSAAGPIVILCGLCPACHRLVHP